MTDVKLKDPVAVPHKYRNRFLREAGSGTSVTSGGSSSGGGSASEAQHAKSADKATYATSAEKLQNARSLWGNSFDGTADVSGSITIPEQAEGDTYIQIGDIQLVYDSENAALKIDGNVYSTGGMSCYGDGSGSISVVTKFSELTDVSSAGTPSKNQVWGWNGSAYAWLTQSGSGATTLAALTDVSSTHSDGQVLYYDSSSSSFKWKTVSSGGATTLAALTDVSSTHSDGQVLYYDSSSSSFKWKTISSGGVTLDTEQTITGKKTFSQQIEAEEGIAFNEGNIDANGNIHLQSSSNSWNFFTDSTNNYKILSLYGSGTLRVGESGRTSYSDLGQGTLELYQAMPYIDFHYAMSGVDYIARLINNEVGVLELDAMNESGETISSSLKIGDAYIKYDSTNNALCVTGEDGATINFYATGGVSAYSALGGFDTLTNLTLTNKLTSKDANITGTATIGTATIGTATIGTSTVTTANVTTATAKKITIGDSGQGITDIQVENGYLCITINSKKYKLSIASVEEV